MVAEMKEEEKTFQMEEEWDKEAEETKMTNLAEEVERVLAEAMVEAKV